MKKSVILLVILSFILVNRVFAEEEIDFKSGVLNLPQEVKSAKLVQIEDGDSIKQAETVFETYKILIIKTEDGYGIYNKETESFMYMPIIDEIEKLTDNNYEFKIKVRNLLGYVNTDTETDFLGSFDDISLFGDYLKVKKDNKFGLLDKSGNTVLKTKFSKISSLAGTDTEYIAAKYKGEYQIYDMEGKLLPDDELYTVVNDKDETLINDLKPELLEYITEQKKKDKEYIAANFVTNNGSVKINGKDFTIKTENGKAGLVNDLGITVIPAEYDLITLRRPCRHFSEDLIYVKNNNLYTAFNEKGDIIVEQFDDRVEVYKYGKVYTYEYSDGKWILKSKNKQLGILENVDNKYRFTRTAYSFRNLHRINKLLISIISM